MFRIVHKYLVKVKSSRLTNIPVEQTCTIETGTYHCNHEGTDRNEELGHKRRNTVASLLVYQNTIYSLVFLVHSQHPFLALHVRFVTEQAVVSKLVPRSPPRAWHPHRTGEHRGVSAVQEGLAVHPVPLLVDYVAGLVGRCYWV